MSPSKPPPETTPNKGIVELLQRSKEEVLTEAEENEFEEMRHLDHLVTSIKAAAYQHLRKAA